MPDPAAYLRIVPPASAWSARGGRRNVRCHDRGLRTASLSLRPLRRLVLFEVELPTRAVEGQFNEFVEIHTLGIARRSAGWCRYESEGRRSTLKARPENGKVAGRCH
jgi:hypothetical protein